MALKIIDEKIVGNIDELEDKLVGKLPVDRLELIYLVNSWGRTQSFYIFDINKERDIYIEKCESKECYNLSKLDTSKINNMDNIFMHSKFTDIHSTNGIVLHNGDISNWDVSNVTSMNKMFFNAKEFNSPLNSWNVSKVKNMEGLFNGAKKFNQDISKWDVSNVTDMGYLFCNTENFNQPLNKWNTGNVINMIGMFGNSIFNQDISQWDISKVTNISYMFYQNQNFNQPLNNWNTSNVETIKSIFCLANKFNQDISNWNTSKITNMANVFYGLEDFNHDISKWDVSNVTNMVSMFEYAIKFNQNISSWKLDKVEKCDYMFEETKAFLDKYNNGEILPKKANDIIAWINNNRERINNIDIKEKHGEKIDNFFSNITDIYSMNQIIK